MNISNALTLGLPAELRLTGNQPNIALTVFFVPYIIFEIPSNILLKKFKPHVWRMFLLSLGIADHPLLTLLVIVSLCMLVFGLVMALQGVGKLD